MKKLFKNKIFKGVVGNVFHKEKLMHQLYFIRGSWNGFTGDMELGKIIKDFKPDKLEYSIVVPNEKVSVGAKMSENVPYGHRM